MQPQASTLQDRRLTEQDRWSIVGYVLSLSPATRPVLHLVDFPKKRDERIGARGRIRAENPAH